MPWQGQASRVNQTSIPDTRKLTTARYHLTLLDAGWFNSLGTTLADGGTALISWTLHSRFVPLLFLLLEDHLTSEKTAASFNTNNRHDPHYSPLLYGSPSPRRVERTLSALSRTCRSPMSGVVGRLSEWTSTMLSLLKMFEPDIRWLRLPLTD